MNKKIKLIPNKSTESIYLNNLYDSLVIPFSFSEYRTYSKSNNSMEKLDKDSVNYSTSYECLNKTINIIDSQIKTLNKNCIYNGDEIVKCRKSVNKIIKIIRKKVNIICSPSSNSYTSDNIYEELLRMSVAIVNEYLSLTRKLAISLSNKNETFDNLLEIVNSNSSKKEKSKISIEDSDADYEDYFIIEKDNHSVDNSKKNYLDVLNFIDKKRVSFRRDIKNDNVKFFVIKSSISYSLLLSDFDILGDFRKNKKKMKKNDFKSFLFLYIKYVLGVYGDYKINIFPVGLRI